MQISTQGSGELAPRHELDRLLPSAVIDASPAAASELSGLAEIARREIPGVNASAGLAHVLEVDPESIFAFRRAGRLLGGIAFLHLNDRGHDALLLNSIDLKYPGDEYLAGPDEDVAAILSGRSPVTGVP